MGSKGGGSQTTVEKSEPWIKAQPYLEDVMASAKNLWQQPHEYFPFQTFVPFSPQTLTGLSLMENYATSPLGLALPTQASSTMLQQLSGDQNPAMPFYQDVLGGNYGAYGATPESAFYMNQMFGPQFDPAMGQMALTASGAYLSPDTNPWLRSTYEQAAEAVRDNVGSEWSMAGRYGSPGHQDVLYDQLGDLATQIYGGAYGQERGHMMNATNMWEQAIRAGNAERFAAAQAHTGMGQQDIANMLQAGQLAGQGTSDYMTNVARMLVMAPSVYEFAQAPGRTLLETGQVYESQAASELKDLMDRWTYGQEGLWAPLQNYANLAFGFGGLGQTSTRTEPIQRASGAQQALSGLSSLAGIFSLFSDRNAKFDIGPAERILEQMEQIPIKSWRYKPEYGLGVDLHVGPMAQDFQKFFGLGDGVTIPFIDAIGVTMLALQQLIRKVRRLEEKFA